MLNEGTWLYSSRRTHGISLPPSWLVVDRDNPNTLSLMSRLTLEKRDSYTSHTLYIYLNKAQLMLAIHIRITSACEMWKFFSSHICQIGVHSGKELEKGVCESFVHSNFWFKLEFTNYCTICGNQSYITTPSTHIYM